MPRPSHPEDESPTLYFSAVVALPKPCSGDETVLRRQVAALDRSGYVALGSGDLDAADVHFGRALELLQRGSAAAHAALPQAFGRLGVVAIHRGDLERAETLLELGLEIARAVRSQLTPEDAMLSQNLGVVARRRGQLAAAERHHASALSIKVAALGWSHPCVATTLCSQGFLHLQQRAAGAALASFDQARQILARCSGEVSPATADIDRARGCAYLRLARPHEAERCFAAALAVRERLPSSPTQLARLRLSLARARWHRDPASALTLAEAALAAYLRYPHASARPLHCLRSWLARHPAQAA